MYKKKVTFMSKALVAILLLVLTLSCLYGCKDKDDPKDENPASNLDLNTPVSLIIAGSSDQVWPAMENVIAKFEAKYSNVTIDYEYMQGAGSVLKTRLDGDTDVIDIFTTSNIQADSLFIDNALDLLDAANPVDLSQANEGLVDNFRYLADTSKLYAIPYGGEMRGLYVNKTLLNSLNLEVPTNRAELLDCCEALSEAGYIPFQSDPSAFAQQLLYPSICNRIANSSNYTETYNNIDTIYDGISEFFEDEYAFLYNDIMANDYFDYKSVQDVYGYKFSGKDGKARDFLNITENTAGVLTKNDDVGKIAFMTDTQAFQLQLETAKKDYQSAIEYEFILAPVGVDGGYAYLSPSTGLAINKKSNHLDWAREFMSFFFSSDVNKAFAAIQGCIPNTADALVNFNVPANRISTVGQCTFSYSFYKTVITLLVEGYKDSYVATTASYITANPSETVYYKDAVTEYKVANAEYRTNNPTKLFYILSGEDYTQTDEAYIAANPDATYYYATTVDKYKAADAAYRTANPDATIYRHVSEIIGISKMNNPKYMASAYTAVTAQYVSSHSSETFYYLDDTDYKAADADYITANPDAQLYSVSYSFMFTLEQYMDRLESEFQIIKQSR